jgi:hypothetical protein
VWKEEVVDSFKVLFRNILSGTEKCHEKHIKISVPPDHNRAPQDIKRRTFTLEPNNYVGAGLEV